jgi:zinc protease
MFGMYGRLGDSVRQAEGLAYYSYSQLVGGLGPGPWKVMAGVDPSKVNRAIELILNEINRIVTEPVSQEELSDNKSFFKGQLVLSLETNDGVATTLQSIELYQLGLDYLHRYEGMIDALTPEAIQSAVARYLHPDNYALAVAGPEMPDL